LGTNRLNKTLKGTLTDSLVKLEPSRMNLVSRDLCTLTFRKKIQTLTENFAQTTLVLIRPTTFKL